MSRDLSIFKRQVHSFWGVFFAPKMYWNMAMELLRLSKETALLEGTPAHWLTHSHWPTNVFREGHLKSVFKWTLAKYGGLLITIGWEWECWKAILDNNVYFNVFLFTGPRGLQKHLIQTQGSKNIDCSAVDHTQQRNSEKDLPWF